MIASLRVAMMPEALICLMAYRNGWKRTSAKEIRDGIIGTLGKMQKKE